MDYKILIADDEPEIRNLLRLYLENENYHVIEAEDAALYRQEITEGTEVFLVDGKLKPGNIGTQVFGC